MTRRTIITLLTAAVLTAVWFVFLFLPVSGKQARLNAEIAAAESQLRNYESTLAQLPSFISARDDLRRRLDDVNEHLYARQDLEKLFSELDRKTRAHSLRLVEITPPVTELLELNRTTPSEGQPQILSLTIVVKGGFIDFGKFVESLEQTPYFRSVQSCVISRGQDGANQVLHSLSFKALLGVTKGEVS